MNAQPHSRLAPGAEEVPAPPHRKAIHEQKPRASGGAIAPAANGKSVFAHLEKITEDHIHDFNFAKITSQDGHHLLHNKAYYTVNEIPNN